MSLRPHLFCFLILLFCTTACNAKGIAASTASDLPANQPSGKEVVASGKIKACRFDEAFKTALLRKSYIVHPPDNIEKPNMVDNIKRVKTLFAGKDNIFFSYSMLCRYAINNLTNKVSARLYCFQFEKSKDAAAWFEAVDQSKSKGNRRLIVFSKPKKLLALSQNQVFLLEGYHISNFDELNLIINQLGNVQAVLGPETTIRKP